MNSGQKLWNKAKTIIPGGNQLLSKRSELFLPSLWPAYYKKAKGYKVWDLNNKVYYDFAGMGVTSCVLGYSNNDINKELMGIWKLVRDDPEFLLTEITKLKGNLLSLDTQEKIQYCKEGMVCVGVLKNLLFFDF